MAQDKDKQTKSTSQDQSEKKDAVTETKAGSKAGQTAKPEQPDEQQDVEQKEEANSLLQVLDFLKNSNLINLDMPLKSLFDQVQNIQADPSTEWDSLATQVTGLLSGRKKNDFTSLIQCLH
ncbi:hypothetical protein KDW_06240 [Dictyobacter vulcani]|uniref:Uncharacterized protein n=2 Tax=Dictyobacter vulcani TaxID=2607529 RepID=A0A5J4KHV4_9CHLR|nr:hypothetical protein KDW_06240 [Dictyobacter vulcani]